MNLILLTGEKKVLEVAENKLIPFSYDDIELGKYKIDKYGNIWSNYKQDYMIIQKDKNGYSEINLRTSKHSSKVIRIATLVAYVFIGSPPKDMKDPTINHKDSDITNNYYKNLEWMERGTNSSIRKNKGAGSSNHEAILNEKDVEEICKMIITTSLPIQKISEIFGVDKSTISNIMLKKNWKEVTEKYNNLKQYRQIYRDEKQRFKSYNPFLQGK